MGSYCTQSADLGRGACATSLDTGMFYMGESVPSVGGIASELPLPGLFVSKCKRMGSGRGSGI